MIGQQKVPPELAAPKKKGAKGPPVICGASSGLSSKLLVFRGILGAIRSEIATAVAIAAGQRQAQGQGRGHGHHSRANATSTATATAYAPATAPRPTAPPHTGTVTASGLVSKDLVDYDSEVGVKVSRLLSSVYSRNNLTVHAGPDGLSIVKVCKGFLKLLLSTHNRGDTAGKDACPAVVATLGEISSILSATRRVKLGDFMMSECDAKLKNPTQRLSEALIHYFVLLAPRSTEDRMRRVVEVAALVQQCSADMATRQEAEREREEEDDNGEEEEGGKRRRGVINGALVGATYALVCGASLQISANTLVSVLEKAVAETEAIVRLREKQRASADAALSRRSFLSRQVGTLDGHISSDDEGGGRARLNRLGGITPADDAVYVTLQRVFEAAVYLLLPNIGDATERVVGLFGKLYKLQARLTRVLCTLKVTVLPARFRDLANYVAQCSATVEQFVTDIHTFNHSASLVKINRQSVVVPQLAESMSQLDAQLVRLTSFVRDKSSVTRLLKQSITRDFRIDNLSTDEEGEAGEGRRGRGKGRGKGGR